MCHYALTAMELTTLMSCAGESRPHPDQNSLASCLVPVPFGSGHERVRPGDAHAGSLWHLITAGRSSAAAESS